MAVQKRMLRKEEWIGEGKATFGKGEKGEDKDKNMIFTYIRLYKFAMDLNF